MKWISVKDRLPEQPKEITEYKRYLCALRCGSCELVTFAHTTSGYHEFIWDENICWSITHWMPLPEPPRQTCRFCEDENSILTKQTCCTGCSKLPLPKPRKEKS